MDLSTCLERLVSVELPAYDRPVVSRCAAFVALLAGCVAAASAVAAGAAGPEGGRVPRIRQRGALVCGVAPGVAGFAHVDEQGRYTGFDVDICRALSAAIFGTP